MGAMDPQKPSDDNGERPRPSIHQWMSQQMSHYTKVSDTTNGTDSGRCQTKKKGQVSINWWCLSRAQRAGILTTKLEDGWGTVGRQEEGDRINNAFVKGLDSLGFKTHETKACFRSTQDISTQMAPWVRASLPWQCDGFHLNWQIWLYDSHAIKSMDHGISLL